MMKSGSKGQRPMEEMHGIVGTRTQGHIEGVPEVVMEAEVFLFFTISNRWGRGKKIVQRIVHGVVVGLGVLCCNFD